MPTSVRLNNETEKRLVQLAVLTGRSKAFYLREAIEISLDDMEDYYLASQVLARVKSGEEEVFSSAEVRKSLGLDN